MMYHGPPQWRVARSGALSTYYYVDPPNKVHSIVVTSVTSDGDIETYTATQIAAFQARGETVEDQGVSTSCDGQPARRFIVRGIGVGNVAMVTHYLVTRIYGGIAMASYAHVASVGDRQDGIDGLAAVCPGPAPERPPLGWAQVKGAAPGGEINSVSPDSTSTFTLLQRPLKETAIAAFENSHAIAGTTLATSSEPCLTTTVKRTSVQAGNQIAEMATAYLHGIEYFATYTRPAAHELDAAADRALTEFCRPIDPSAAPAV